MRIGGRGDVHRHGSRQSRFVERVEVRQKSVGDGGRKIDRFAAGGAGARAIGRIEGIGHQNGRFALAVSGQANSGLRREEKSFAAAAEHQQFGLGVDGPGQVETPGQPAGCGTPEGLDALGDRVAAEVGNVFGQHRADERRHGVLRLA